MSGRRVCISSLNIECGIKVNKWRICDWTCVIGGYGFKGINVCDKMKNDLCLYVYVCGYVQVIVDLKLHDTSPQ